MKKFIVLLLSAALVAPALPAFAQDDKKSSAEERKAKREARREKREAQREAKREKREKRNKSQAPAAEEKK